LKESVTLQWSGDVDLNDGSLQEQYDKYRKCLEMAEKAGLNKDTILDDLEAFLQDLIKDLDFIHSGTLWYFIQMHLLCYNYAELKSANDTYSLKLCSDKHKDKDMISLSWKIKEIGELNEMGRVLHEEIIFLRNGIKEK